MFQTEVIIFIQSFATNFLTFLFKFWTEIGYIRWIIPIMLIILFGINFRIGYILIHALMWNGIFTLYLKEVFALPRPDAVDLKVKLLSSNLPNPTQFESMGAKSFFGTLPKEVVQAFRSNPTGTWGFPSGHTSNAMTFGGMLFMVFKEAWIRVIALVMILFIPFSRLYLGRHFMADIIGGYIIGFFLASIFFSFVYKSDWIKELFEIRDRLYLNLRKALLFFYLLFLPFLLLTIPNINHEVVAGLLGLNIGFLLVRIKGIPKNTGAPLQRIFRVLVAFGVYYASNLLLIKFCNLLYQNEPGAIAFTRLSLTGILLIWGSTEISIKLGFFKREASG